MSIEDDDAKASAFLQQCLVEPETTKPLEDFVGLDHAKTTVTEYIMLPMRFPQLFSKFIALKGSLSYIVCWI